MIPGGATVAATIERARPILDAIQQAGGWPLIVGGAVRDALLGGAVGDIDIEAYGLSVDALIAALAPLGKVNAVGRSFGVIKLRTSPGDEFDIAIPQRDSRNPSGQRGAIPSPDPHTTPREAAARRDFTWNALALTPTGDMLDFYGGADDLRDRVIRHVSPAFAEDPLRVLRAMRLAARFNMRLAPETAALCQTLLPLASSLAVERVWSEWSKWSQTPFPSAGLRVLLESGWIALYPELQALVGCPQSPEYHPEGDVWTHTGFVCAAAARIAARQQLGEGPRRTLLFAALCHDLGKPATTEVSVDGRVRSPGHAQAGADPALALLRRIGGLQDVIAQVLPLVREHMSHYGQPNDRVVRRLAARLHPASVTTWAYLVEADHSGRPPLPPRNPAAPFLAVAQELDISNRPPPPLLTGHDLLRAGYVPGPPLGVLLKQAYQAQLDGAFATAEEGLAWVRQLEREQPLAGEG